MSAREIIPARPSASSEWWRSIATAICCRDVPAPGENPADQRVVDPELVAFFADSLLGGAGDRVEVGALARVQAADHEATDVVEEAATASSSRSGQPTARPTCSAACWVARAWTRNRSGRRSRLPLGSKKSKTLAVPAIARTPEGLRMSTASGIVAAPRGGCRRGWRPAGPRRRGRRRIRPLRRPRRRGRSRRSPPSSPGPGTRPGPGSARPPRTRRPGVRRARAFRAPLDAPARSFDLAARSCVFVGWHDG